jgi:tetratricopeptide (TPR) repeat protein
MYLIKLFFLCFFTIVLVKDSYSQALSAKEAVNYYNEGVRAQKNGDFDAAMTAYKKTSLLSSYYNKFCMNNEGVIYAQLGDIKRAEALFNAVIAMDPDYLPAKLNIGMIYDMQVDKIKALEYWANVFEIDKLKPKTFTASEEQPIPK